jgi:hypothetical protein
MASATPVWHHDRVDQEPEMTELDEAIADRLAAADDRRLYRLQDALYAASKGRKQVDLVRRTGLTRETIRRHIEDAKIRRGEIEPNERYLREQARREARAKREAQARRES